MLPSMHTFDAPVQSIHTVYPYSLSMSTSKCRSRGVPAVYLLCTCCACARWHGCSEAHQSPCSEDWAVALAGRRMASIRTAMSYAELQARLASLPVVEGKLTLAASPPEVESPFGFATHIHNTTHVLFDGNDPNAFNGMPLQQWFATVGLSSNDAPHGTPPVPSPPHHPVATWQVGLSSNDFARRDPAGEWIGPFVMRTTRDGSYGRRYLLVVSLSRYTTTRGTP
jgi:hypothetical protein